MKYLLRVTTEHVHTHTCTHPSSKRCSDCECGHMAKTCLSKHKGWVYLNAICLHNIKVTKHWNIYFYTSVVLKRDALGCNPMNSDFICLTCEFGVDNCSVLSGGFWYEYKVENQCFAGPLSPKRKAKTLGWIGPQLKLWLRQSLPLAVCCWAGYSQTASSSVTWKL